MSIISNLFYKYDVSGPRYTSYPPLPFWEKTPTDSEWFSHIRKSIHANKKIDLYIHIPFCNEICHYCGCNRIKLSDANDLKKYVDYIIKEWKIYKTYLPDVSIQSIHFGGGTPTILQVEEIERLLDAILGYDKIDIIGSLEIDPRCTSIDQLKIFAKFGFKRLSFGIQDFEESVQKKIGRIQGFESVSDIYYSARKIGFNDINFDLIFGLPGQNTDSVNRTFDKVLKLRPDTLAYYSFAYVPHFAKNQEMISPDDLLNGKEKWNLCALGRKSLLDFGYKDVGMDHYALENSNLYKSFINKKLHRNFMGYVAYQSHSLIGLGLSSISSNHYSFAQNSKDFDSYYKSIENKKLSFIKGHLKSDRDKKTEQIILDVMCKNFAVINNDEKKLLEVFEQDGLIKIEKNTLTVLVKGRPFIRNICMAFDWRLKENKGNIVFSKTI